MAKSFCTSRPVNENLHFVVDRTAVADEIARDACKNYLIMYGHRQSGKTSLTGQVMQRISEQGLIPLYVDFSDIHIEKPGFWKRLGDKLNNNKAGKVFQHMNSEADFHRAFEAITGEETPDFVFVFDEFHNVIGSGKYAEQKSDFLRVLRAFKSCMPGSYKVRGALFAGVMRILSVLAYRPNKYFPPFNVCNTVRLQHPREDHVVALFKKVGTTFAAVISDTDMELVAQDIYKHTGGHVGLVSMYGDWLVKYLEECTKTSIMGSFPAWMRYQHSQTLTDAINHRINANFECLLDSSDPDVVVAREFLSKLLNSNVLRDEDDVYMSSLIDFLESESIVMRATEYIDRREITFVCFTSPLVRRALYDCMDVVANPPGIALAHYPSRRVDLAKTLCTALQYMQLSSLYHDCVTFARGIPYEFSFHFQLYRVISALGRGCNVNVTCEIRDARLGFPKRLDILLDSSDAEGEKCGYELLVNATEEEMRHHFEDHAVLYVGALQLSSLMIVNFTSQKVSDVRPAWWFTSTNDKIAQMHVHMPSPATVKDALARNEPVTATVACSADRKDDVSVVFQQQRKQGVTWTRRAPRAGDKRRIAAVQDADLDSDSGEDTYAITELLSNHIAEQISQIAPSGSEPELESVWSTLAGLPASAAQAMQNCDVESIATGFLMTRENPKRFTKTLPPGARPHAKLIFEYFEEQLSIVQ